MIKYDVPSTAKYPLPRKVTDFAKRISCVIKIYVMLINQKLQEIVFTPLGKEYYAVVGTQEFYLPII